MAGASETTSKKLSPFDFLNSINFTKENLIKDDFDNTKYYNGYLVNRSLSYFPDTVQFANAMNMYHHLDRDLQYQFLLNIVRKKKRFSKWAKQTSVDDIDVVKKYFQYSESKAREVINLLNEQQLQQLRDKVRIGGRQ